MNEFIDPGLIEEWLKQQTYSNSGDPIKLIEIEQTPQGCRADYDTSAKTGRITVWSMGFFEFEIHRWDDGKQIYFRHEDQPRLDAPVLVEAISEFFYLLKAESDPL